MKNRRRFVVYCLPATVAFLVGLWVTWPRSAITKDNADRLRNGMTLEQVEAVLGGHARDETSGRVVQDLPDGSEAPVFHSTLNAIPGIRHWVSDRWMIRVDFDLDDHVISWSATPVHRENAAALEMLRRLLHL